MGTTNDDMHVVVTHRDTNLVIGTMRGKHTVSAEYGYLPAERQSRSGGHCILLGNAHGEETLRIGLRKEVHPDRIGDVGTQTDHPIIFLSRSKNALAEARFGGFISFVGIIHNISFVETQCIASLRQFVNKNR